MTPGPDAAFAEACADLCPGFRAVGPLRFARKTVLLPGEVAGRPVYAKQLRRPSAVWAWYLAREVAVYRAAAVQPLPVRAPALIAATDELLVIERLPGAPLATRRHPNAALPVALVADLVAALAGLARWPGVLPTARPPAVIAAQLRTRLLEDPTDPAWQRDGVATAVAQGLIDAGDARRIVEALAAHAPIAFGHGDLLLRNLVSDGAGVGLVDWECAGPHVADWDLALLWTQLAPPSRAPIEAVVFLEPARRQAFGGLVAFALLRELRFLRAFKAGPAKARALRGELAEALAAL